MTLRPALRLAPIRETVRRLPVVDAFTALAKTRPAADIGRIEHEGVAR